MEIKLAVICVFMAVIQGCASTERIVYRSVAVPVKCTVELPFRPESTGDAAVDALAIAEYALIAEEALKFCTGMEKSN